MRPWIFLLPLGCACGSATATTTTTPTVVVLPSATSPQAVREGSRAAPRSVSPRAAAWEAILSAAAESDGPDAVLLRRGHALQSLGDLAGARKAYFELVKDHPASRFVPCAYVAFGDMFLDASTKDRSMLALAEKAYREAVTFPPTANMAHAFAWYELGLVAARQGDDPKALGAQRKAATAVTEPAQAAASRVAGAARGELVLAYSRVGDPKKAWNFFLATDAANTQSMVVALGDAYVAAAKAQDLVALYDTFLQRGDDLLCTAAGEAERELASGADATTARLLAGFEARRKTTCGP